MLGYSIVNSKGQVTIPADIRKKLGIKPGQTMAINKDADMVIIKPAGGYESLQGIIKSTKKPNPKKMRENFEKYLGTRKHA